MRDPKKREMLQALYRWAERYEEVPRIDPLDHEAAGKYFEEAWQLLNEIIQKYGGGTWAEWMAIGYYQALDEVYKEVNGLAQKRE